MGFRVINGSIYPVCQDLNIAENKNKVNNNLGKSSFKNILKSEVNKGNSEFVISNHAAQRLKDRNISLNASDMEKINEGINKAAQKGCCDSAILYKDSMLIANIKNRTIITAINKDSSKENVFTNIDSVILL